MRRTKRTKTTRAQRRAAKPLRIPSKFERFLGRHRIAVVVATIVVLVLGGIGVGVTVQLLRTAWHSATATPPLIGTAVLAPFASKAQHAIDEELAMTDAQRAATEYLAAQPTAYWLTPEQDPSGLAGVTVSALVNDAREQDVSVALVIYGLPGRDCGNHSDGGLPMQQYLGWLREIDMAMDTAPDVRKIIILEPDSLALAPECGNYVERAEQLREAVSILAGAHTWIYVDAGHSGWLPADQMAGLISQLNLGDQIRGFATNVSNYRSTYDEFAYAHELASRLPGLHAIVDTSRNGTATAGAEWCNPPGQTIGDPTGTFGDAVVDMNLWIKPPGESDGPCHGGPAAGVWWPDGAVDLTRGVQ